jgi:hypothetical protein
MLSWLGRASVLISLINYYTIRYDYFLRSMYIVQIEIYEMVLTLCRVKLGW